MTSVFSKTAFNSYSHSTKSTIRIKLMIKLKKMTETSSSRMLDSNLDDDKGGNLEGEVIAAEFRLMKNNLIIKVNY